ncbi:response regulator [Mesorhizobium sp. CA6]|uniref:response regulator n=1 Tax=Mesorhizobium sp. CA6 TaxID=588500 RepID=UPI0021E2B9DA|nr:response regulator [Mesorhizobium sp. CA6]
MILLGLESALEEAGFEVVGANIAASAVAAYDAEPEKFKALVADFRLGSGETGWELARHFRHANNVLPVVYISGDSAARWGSRRCPEQHHDSQPVLHATDSHGGVHLAQPPVDHRPILTREPVGANADA